MESTVDLKSSSSEKKVPRPNIEVTNNTDKQELKLKEDNPNLVEGNAGDGDNCIDETDKSEDKDVHIQWQSTPECIMVSTPQTPAFSTLPTTCPAVEKSPKIPDESTDIPTKVVSDAQSTVVCTSQRRTCDEKAFDQEAAKESEEMIVTAEQSSTEKGENLQEEETAQDVDTGWDSTPDCIMASTPETPSRPTTPRISPAEKAESDDVNPRSNKEDETLENISDREGDKDMSVTEDLFEVSEEDFRTEVPKEDKMKTQDKDDLKLDDIEKSLQAENDTERTGKSFDETEFNQIMIRGDGYCMVNSVLTALRQQCPKCPTKEMVLEKIKPTFQMDIDKYWTSILSDTDPLREIDEYVATGKYLTDIADFILAIIAEILNITINVLFHNKKNKTYELLNDKYIYKPSNENGEPKIVYVVNTRKDHYNALIFRKSKRIHERKNLEQERESNMDNAQEKRQLKQQNGDPTLT